MDLNDRGLAVVGGGAFLTVLCLLFQWPFAIRIAVGLFVMVTAMIVGIKGFGADKEPLEKYVARRIVALIKPQKYTYQDGEEEQGSVAPQGTVFSQPASTPIGPSSVINTLLAPAEPIESSFVSNVSLAPTKLETVPTIGHITFDWEEIGIYRLVTIWLVVIGIYFIYWLATGGTEQIGFWMRTMFKLP
jgi:hypothetical protein